MNEPSEPWFFGQPGHELFGWLHGKAEEASPNLGVVLCGTLGIESLSSHRQLRILAESLAENGIPTLRFDYAGSGDSVDPGGAVRLSTYIDNVRTAIQFVRAQRAVDRVVVVGVRLGGLFAAKAAELEHVSGLVLWGPVVSGKRFVREWNMMAQRAELPHGPAGDDTVNAAGFTLERTFLEELTGCSLLEAEPRGVHACLVVERDELSPEDKLVGRLKELGLATDRCRPGGFLAGMVAEPHLTEVPVKAIGAIRDWIANTGRDPSHSKVPHTHASLQMTKTVLLPEQHAGIRTRERFLGVNETDGVFGIISEPVDPTDWNGQCIVLLNAGSAHHIGPNRMHVEFARRMASEGSRVCRADLRGLGDSRALTGSRDNDPYPAGAVEDIKRIVQSMRLSGECSRVALAGLCSGAWASFHAGLAVDGVTDVVLINPDFYGERSVVGKPASFVRPKDYSHYKHSARSLAKWRKLLTGRANLPKIVRVLWNQARLKVASLRLKMAGQHHQLDDDLTRLAISGVRVGFIFSPGDGGADFLKMNGRSGLERLRRSGLLREITISDTDHPFSLPGAKHRLADTLSEWLR